MGQEQDLNFRKKNAVVEILKWNHFQLEIFVCESPIEERNPDQMNQILS